jgi:anti-anti-sigma regulatory factor
MLQIKRSLNGGVVFTLVGRIEIEHVPELQRLLRLEEGDDRIAFDLQDVTLIDRDAVKFLAGCEADTIRLDNCPAYLRVWIDREKKRTSARKT